MPSTYRDAETTVDRSVPASDEATFIVDPPRTTKILFVDDEERILSGLRRLLRGQRSEWSMSFANSGVEALEFLRADHFDCIVSDVRMPGMDGIQLLDTVREEYPDIIRIILSGHTDRNDLLRATGVAHQYLSKPCDPAELVSAIKRSGALRAVLQDEALQRAVAGTVTLPARPELFTKLTAEVSSEDASLQRVAQLISQDIAMAVKTMQLVNSSFFGLRREVRDLNQAVSLLGLDIMIGLVLAAHVFRGASGNSPEAALVNRLWGETFRVAATARNIARTFPSMEGFADRCFMAGMMYNCGKLVFLENWPERALQLYAHDSGERETLSGELEAFGASSAAVGAYLVALWGLTDEVVEAVAFHTDPSQVATEVVTSLAVLHVARGLVACESECDIEDHLDMEYLGRIGIADRLEDWKGLVERGVAEL